MTTLHHTGLQEASQAQEVSAAVATIYERLPEDFRARWEAVQGHEPRELAERVARDFDDRPEERREILIAYLAQRLGYSWAFNRHSTLIERPLWGILRIEEFSKLQEGDQEIVLLVAMSTRRVRPALEPRAALAVIALWRFGTPEMQRKAEAILCTRPLPVEEAWYYELIRTLAAREVEFEVDPPRRLFALFALQHAAGFFSVVSLGIGLYFTRRYGSFFSGTSTANVIRACEAAAADFRPRMEPWIELAAEAAVVGRLSSPWLEPLVAAAIRHRVGRVAAYRAFHAGRPYKVSAARVAELYAGLLSLVRRGDAHAGAQLLADVDAIWDSNPARARDLLELVISETGTSKGDRGARLTRVLEAVEDIDPLVERLVALYIITFDLRTGAVGLVRRLVDRIDLTRWGVLGLDVDVYLASADYDAPLKGLKVMYAGVEIDHIDKDAAALVHYFLTKRHSVNTLTGIVQNFAAPPEWFATQVSTSPFVDRLFNRTMEAFSRMALARRHDGRVTQILARTDQVQQFQEIPVLPARSVLRAAQHARHKALLSAAFAGAVAGAAAPATQGASAVFDAPFVMALTAEVCAATCWYFGFDPADDPMLPVTILAIALGGAHARWDSPDDVHRRLHMFLVRKSLILAGLGQGAFKAVLGPTFASGIEVIRERTGRVISKGRLVRLLRKDAEDDWSRRVLARANVYALPVVEGVAGAMLNLALMYDICESAEVVLTDRFLARKYPHWVRTW